MSTAPRARSPRPSACSVRWRRQGDRGRQSLIPLMNMRLAPACPAGRRAPGPSIGAIRRNGTSRSV
ncbi:hypothetical protein HBB16_09605 [Pseudonocardia sp. MCCB 268]|nr:hypothetical protein [Pseudonocardia cytotoxica]